MDRDGKRGWIVVPAAAAKAIRKATLHYPGAQSSVRGAPPATPVTAAITPTRRSPASSWPPLPSLGRPAGHTRCGPRLPRCASLHQRCQRHRGHHPTGRHGCALARLGSQVRSASSQQRCRWMQPSLYRVFIALASAPSIDCLRWLTMKRFSESRVNLMSATAAVETRSWRRAVDYGHRKNAAPSPHCGPSRAAQPAYDAEIPIHERLPGGLRSSQV